MRVCGRRDRGIGIEEVYVSRGVRDDGDSLVLKSAAGLLGDDRSVGPHGARYETPVVCEDACVDVDEVLRVERRRHEVDGFEGDAAYDERGGGVESGERHALPCAHGVALLAAEGVHRLDRLCLPVGDDVRGVLVESEVASEEIGVLYIWGINGSSCIELVKVY